MKSSKLFLSMMLVSAGLSVARPAQAVSFADWLESQKQASLVKMNENISPSGTMPGVVIASPSRQDPDYYFHWIRDSALVLDAVLLYKEDPAYAGIWKTTLSDFVDFSRLVQRTASLTGLGEPRYNTDGTPFFGPWARPQNDGPALRVVALHHALAILDAEPSSRENTLLKDKIIDIMLIDLDYILSHWQSPCYDIWEEVRGQHFYTSVAQLSAIEKSLSRPELVFPTSYQVRDALKLELAKYWQANAGYFSVTRDRLDGAEGYKFTDLDTAVVLGVLHAQREGDEFTVRDSRVLATSLVLEKKFATIYAINASAKGAPAIGRYADDVYFGGNPWYITTAAFAELLYNLANSLEKNPAFVIDSINQAFFENILQKPVSRGIDLSASPTLQKEVLQALRARGDSFMQTFRSYTPASGSLSEQFERADGHQVSARDLTWSYASFLTALWVR